MEDGNMILDLEAEDAHGYHAQSDFAEHKQKGKHKIWLSVSRPPDA